MPAPSMLGYAASEDGIRMDERLAHPVYMASDPLQSRNKDTHLPFPYASGGSGSGCEDPRLTKIDDTIYMTYTAFNGWQPPAVALTSIKVKDFLKKIGDGKSRSNFHPLEKCIKTG